LKGTTFLSLLDSSENKVNILFLPVTKIPKINQSSKVLKNKKNAEKQRLKIVNK